MTECEACEQLSRIVAGGLRAGRAVEIEGLGTFRPDPLLGVRFEPRLQPQVFIAYVKEDEAKAARLYTDLAAAGFTPWMDVRKLLPGQNWPRAIENAIESSDFFVACFSSHSVHKKGGFQAELRYALDCARQIPLDDIFIVPVRFDECAMPRSISLHLQYIDLFPDRERGFAQLVSTMRRDRA
ncbi:MAG: toll/interleukin-1 receptor domain-containing protein [Acidobacteriota bacterium]|nr:toll/interleukin-1 receptor domain-containing protein [Acidobacteriota bacterium]